MLEVPETTPLAILDKAQTLELVDEDGEPVELRLDPGMSESEIAEFEQALPCAIPPTIRDLLGSCKGFSGPVDIVDFTGETLSFEFETAFPHGIPIATDGFGNHWVVDLWPDSSAWGPVYFVCHDAPVVLVQSPNLAQFLNELFKLNIPPFESAVDDVHEDRIFEVWRKNPGVLSHDECLSSGDASLASFAKELGPSFLVIDLRDAEVGSGFSWGRYGPQTVVRRHGREPIFAYEQRKGFFAKLFGGSS